MLSSIPTELQTQVLSYLPRKDLAAVARVSQHLHAAAIKILYLKVELRSSGHLDSFFLPGSFIPSGSISAIEHTESRREHWNGIKDLTLYSSINDQRLSFPLPRSLRGRHVEPLLLEHLRLFYSETKIKFLLPLLETVNPKELVLSPAGYARESESLILLLQLKAWKRLEQVTFGLCAGFVPIFSFGFESSIASSSFSKVIRTSLFLRWPP